MSLTAQLLRPLPPDFATWAAETLPADDPYRQIGDTFYAELYIEYAVIVHDGLERATGSSAGAGCSAP
jgi:hypothetical protein